MFFDAAAAAPGGAASAAIGVACANAMHAAGGDKTLPKGVAAHPQLLVPFSSLAMGLSILFSAWAPCKPQRCAAPISSA